MGLSAQFGALGGSGVNVGGSVVVVVVVVVGGGVHSPHDNGQFDLTKL
jgi:hypothetical protein